MLSLKRYHFRLYLYRFCFFVLPLVAITVAAITLSLQNSTPPKTSRQTSEQTSEVPLPRGQGITLSAPSESSSSRPAAEFASPEIDSIVNRMTLAEKVGQMIIARNPSPDPSIAASMASQYHLGGYLLFAEDFAGKTATEVRQFIAAIQSASEIPLFIAVDEEGGVVNRLSLNPNLRSEPFRSPQALFDAGGLALIKSDAAEKSDFLKNLGINLNFAPVADVSTDPKNFIFDRAFGRSAPETAQYVRTVVETMKTKNLGSTLKHFPGYGDNADTHDALVFDSRPLESFENSDFLPFRAGIDAGADLVLFAHDIATSLDPDLPASLSPRIHQILRDDLDFDGLTITDDLAMSGVRNFASDEDIAVLAVQAGNDLLCSTNFETQTSAIISAVEAGTISEDRLDQSVARILETKRELGLLDFAAAETP